MSKTLSTRIIAYSGSWVFLALIVSAGLLIYYYRDHVSQHYDAHVDMHLEELTGASGFSPDGTFSISFLPSDPRYNDLDSGWYWDVRQAGRSLMQSPSLNGFMLDISSLTPSENKVVYEASGPGGKPIRLHVVETPQGDGQDPLVFLASAPMTDVTDDIVSYSDHIIGSFFLLGIGLLLAVVLQVRIALKPLKSIGVEISGIRDGKTDKLSRDYPSDVQPLVDELNNLLDHNAVLLKRARNQLGDLAHSVKNPLSIINNEARNMEHGQRELILRQTGDINDNINHYLTRARTFGTENVLGARSEVRKVVEDMVYTLQRLFQDKGIRFDIDEVEHCSFRGEDQDLEEMVGNLMDNASKWAKDSVVVTAKVNDGRLHLVVADDGPGIPASEIENVKRRGHKLDESKVGHGQGLGIVKDIAELYGGALNLGKSTFGGLHAELNLPAA